MDKVFYVILMVIAWLDVWYSIFDKRGFGKKNWCL